MRENFDTKRRKGGEKIMLGNTKIEAKILKGCRACHNDQKCIHGQIHWRKVVVVSN